jgi:hypothetical protein
MSLKLAKLSHPFISWRVAMMSAKKMLLLSGMLCAIAASSAQAAVVLNQNFDNTTLFDASVTTPRSIGDINTVGGEWGPFDSVVDGEDKYGPWVVNDGSNPAAVNIGPAQSGTQSIGFKTLFPGGENQAVQVFGRVNAGVPATENYEVSFSLYQADFRASSMFTIGGDYVGADPQPIDLRVFFEGGTQNIYLLYNTGVQGQGFWIYTGIQMVEDTWMKVRVVADVNGTNEYNIFVTHEGATEEVAGEQPVPLHMPPSMREEIWQLDFSRQGDTGNTTYFDDFKLSYASDLLLGDFNLDGSVDAADYTVWRDGFAIGEYTQDDYNDWKSNFGASSGSASGNSPVPEPTSFVALLIGLGLLLPCSVSRRSRCAAGHASAR